MFDAHPETVREPLRTLSSSPALSAAAAVALGADEVAMLLRCALDEVDYGMLLVDTDGRLLWLNHAARQTLDAGHPLQSDGRSLRAAPGADAAALAKALSDARRGCRTTLFLGAGGQRACVTVRPLAEGLPAAGPLMAAAAGGGTLLMLEKAAICGDLALDAFARAMGLTGAETRVLHMLCDGVPPTEIARANGVGIATVRTQIGAIRHKVGARSIRDLQRRIASLPPMVSALRNGTGAPRPGGAGLGAAVAPAGPVPRVGSPALAHLPA